MRGSEKMGVRGDISVRWLFGFLIIGILLAVLVGATAPQWVNGASSMNYTTSEGEIFYHNFSSNITGFAEDVNFSIDTDTEISWTNGSGTYSVAESVVASWISITNASSGNLTINATTNDQTGFFVIPIQATNTSADGGAIVEEFEFIINATNDYPNFTSSGIRNNYTFTSDSSSQIYYVNASDEESHYPLIFNITFNETNCTHGASTGFSDNSDCNLLADYFSLSFDTSFTDTSAKMDFSPNESHVGVFWANISVMDASVDYDCPHDYCDEGYNSSNLTTYYSQMIRFEVYSSLSLDVSHCNNFVANEGDELACWVNVTSQGETDSLSSSSVASLRNYADSGISDTAWFFAANISNASNFNQAYLINVTPSKEEIGNWSINFSVNDVTSGQTDSSLIYVAVVRNVSLNNVPVLSLIANSSNLSIDYAHTISFNATDTDLSIPDKQDGYDEVLTFNISNFTKDGVSFDNSDGLFGISKTSTSGNSSYAQISFNANSSQAGVYVLNVTVWDKENATDFQDVNLTISDNSFPSWNESSYNISFSVNSTWVTTEVFYLNLTNGYVNDTSDDVLTFTNSSGIPTNFSMTSTGIINFTPWKQDVGNWSFNITATDAQGLVNTTAWTFNIGNINNEINITSLKFKNSTAASWTSISEGLWINLSEDAIHNFTMDIQDFDFLIGDSQISASGALNETATINITFTNATGSVVNDLFSFSLSSAITSYEYYEKLSYIPDWDVVGTYNVTINVTDVSGVNSSRTFYMNISSTGDAPSLYSISNYTRTTVSSDNYIYIDVNATDQEDDVDGTSEDGDLTYNMTWDGGEDLFDINRTTGIMSYTFNSSQTGTYTLNVSVNDTSGNWDWQTFQIKVYGAPNVTFPVNGSTLEVLAENVTTILNFTTNHTHEDNVTYEFWTDSITCAYNDTSDCAYGNFTLIDSVNYLGNGSNYSWSFTPNFTDETYGHLKNLTLVVYPNSSEVPNASYVNTTFNLKLNITHTNAPVRRTHNIGSLGPATWGASSPISVSLGSYFMDEDYFDTYYVQDVNFLVTTSASNTIIRVEANELGNRVPWNGTVTDWDLQFYGEQAGYENLTILANDSESSVSNGPFQVQFTAPSVDVVTTPTGGGGGSTKIKHYSLKIVLPQDVVVSEYGTIKVPFVIKNSGSIDLKGIDLSSFVEYNNKFDSNMKISLGDDHIDELKTGASENFTMTIYANTQRSGKYKATVFANVTSPKFSDWGEFYIELQKANETDAEQILVFTEKFISENPECLELTEIVKEAEQFFIDGDFSNSLSKSREAIEACENAIAANEQVKYRRDKVADSFYYISFSTLVIFFLGFVFYFYKRVRFNKAKVDEYI
jgi:hypothetical protein